MNKRTILAGKLAGNVNKRTAQNMNKRTNVAGNMNKRTPQKMELRRQDKESLAYQFTS